MTYKFSPLVLITLLWISMISCDDTLTPKDYDDIDPYVTDLTVNPSDLTFDSVLDGQKDTTITFDLNVMGFNFETDAVPYYSVFIGDDDIPFIQEKFPINFSPITTFQTSFSIETNTIEFETYTILVTPTLSGGNQNYAQAIVSQSGVPINAPEILEVNNPDTLIRPLSGSTNAFFTAKVFDPDGQQNIDRVLIRIIDTEVGEVQGSPFEMFDDGSSNQDQIANDSVYTFSLPVTPTNNRPDRDFNIEYIATDISGLRSDTLRTIFIIRDP